MVTKAAGGVHHFPFFLLLHILLLLPLSQTICLCRGETDTLIGSLRLWVFLTSAFRAVCYTCLPSSSADGRGWDRCPNLCFDLPGKIVRKGTKGPRTLRTSHHSASTSYKTHYPLSAWTRSDCRSRKESGFDWLLFGLLKVWTLTRVHWNNLETLVYVGCCGCFPTWLLHLCTNNCALGVWWWAVRHIVLAFVGWKLRKVLYSYKFSLK